MTAYKDIQPSGGDTGAALNLRRRIALMQKYVPLENKRILDCGCGTGDYVLGLSALSDNVCGVEYEQTKVDVFNERNPDSGQVQQGDIENLPYDDNSIDVILLNEVLEHVPNDQSALDEVFRVLTPGGHVIIFSPNRLYPFETHSTKIKKSGKTVPYYFPFIPYLPLPLGQTVLEYNARNYFPWELAGMARKSHFSVKVQTAIWQTFENISGQSPKIIQALSPLLRAISLTLEKIPLIKFFGVSQVAIGRKPDTHTPPGPA